METSVETAFDPPGGWGRLRRCRHGLFLFNKNDSYVGRSLDLYGEYSQSETALLSALLRPGDIFIDAGANIGSLTVPLARKIGPKGAGYAFEPQRLNFQMLCANLALNGLTNVSARNAGLSNAPAIMTAPLYDPSLPDNYGDVRLAAELNGISETVPVTTIDTLETPHCRLIKIDVQGMEARVLDGAERTIARCRPALSVENDDRSRSPALIRRIRAMNYRLWWHLPALYNPDNFNRCAENVFGGVGSSNMICLPAEAPDRLNLPEVTDEDDWGFDRAKRSRA
jgi:FkbM family methyltransferase